MPELIDKQETLKKKCETCGYCESLEKAMRATHPDFVADKCNAYKFIAEQPTIEPKVRHGRWTDNGEDKFICSACKGYVYRWFGKSDFCPRCGADMREEGADNADN